VFIGAGTAVNVVAVLVGSGAGILLGHRLPERTRTIVTDVLGLVTLLIAALSVSAVLDPVLTGAAGDQAPVLIVLGALLVGSIIGSLLRLEDRIAALGGRLQRRLAPADAPADRQRFIEGFLTASLLFCVGPLTILGSLTEGMGDGADQLVLKSVLDGFAAVAFAAAFGVGVMASALSVLVIQGTLTAAGALVGAFVPDPHLAALTATGGIVLAAVGLRLLAIRSVAVADLLPALIIAPALTQLVIVLR